jgi:hypothetical protein
MDLKKDTNVSVNILNYKKVETYSERGAKIDLLKKWWKCCICICKLSRSEGVLRSREW